jgi:hypothetical protein
MLKSNLLLNELKGQVFACLVAPLVPLFRYVYQAGKLDKNQMLQYYRLTLSLTDKDIF